jgi:hypothetical protein
MVDHTLGRMATMLERFLWLLQCRLWIAYYAPAVPVLQYLCSCIGIGQVSMPASVNAFCCWAAF